MSDDEKFEMEKPSETPDLCYIRPSPMRRFPAEMCVKYGNDFFVVVVTQNQLENIVQLGLKYMKEFDKRPVEDVDVE